MEYGKSHTFNFPKDLTLTFPNKAYMPSMDSDWQHQFHRMD